VSDNGRKERLLAVSALPTPVGAKIRVNVTFPPEFTQYDLSITSDSELRQLQPELYAMFNKIPVSSGIKFLEMKIPRIERINKKLAFVIVYTRTGAYGSSPWQVAQYRIPVSNRVIQFTLSYRLSDAIVWKSILEKVKSSIKF